MHITVRSEDFIEEIFKSKAEKEISLSIQNHKNSLEVN